MACSSLSSTRVIHSSHLRSDDRTSQWADWKNLNAGRVPAHVCAGWGCCVVDAECWDCCYCAKGCTCQEESKSKDSWPADGVTSTINEDRSVESDGGWGASLKSDAWDAVDKFDADSLHHKCRSNGGISCRGSCGNCGLCPKRCRCNSNPSPESVGWNALSHLSSMGDGAKDEGVWGDNMQSSCSEASSGAGGRCDADTDPDGSSKVQPNSWNFAPSPQENNNNRFTDLEHRVSNLELTANPIITTTSRNNTTSCLETLGQAILNLNLSPPPPPPSYQTLSTSFIATVEQLQNASSHLSVSTSIQITLETLKTQRASTFNAFREKEEEEEENHPLKRLNFNSNSSPPSNSNQDFIDTEKDRARNRRLNKKETDKAKHKLCQSCGWRGHFEMNCLHADEAQFVKGSWEAAGL